MEGTSSGANGSKSTSSRAAEACPSDLVTTYAPQLHS